MNKQTKIFTNIGIIAMVTVIFSGCTLFPSQEKPEMPSPEEPVSVEDPTFTELSDDDSLEVIEAEIDATVIEDENVNQLENDLEVGVTE